MPSRDKASKEPSDLPENLDEDARGQDQHGRDQDDVILAPYTTVQKKLLAITHVQSAYVSAISPDATHIAEEQITELLRQGHKLASNRVYLVDDWR